MVNFLPLAVRHKRLLSPGQQAVTWASWSHLFMLAEQWATNRRPSFLAEAGVLPTNGPEDDDEIRVLQLAFFLQPVLPVSKDISINEAIAVITVAVPTNNNLALRLFHFGHLFGHLFGHQLTEHFESGFY